MIQRRSSGCWDGVSAAKKENLCRLWTSHLDELEAEVVRMQNGSQRRGPYGPFESTTNVLGLLSDMFADERYQMSQQKRHITLSYVRAIDDLGDMRLDLFSAFWDYLRRASPDFNLLPNSKWLTFWLTWCADTSCRNQPLKSCCWIRNLHHTRVRISRQMNAFKSPHFFYTLVLTFYPHSQKTLVVLFPSLSPLTCASPNLFSVSSSHIALFI